MSKKYLLLIGLIVQTTFFSYSQSVTNSPYSYFGIGDVERNGFNHSKAMGGLSTGLRAKNQINYMNPAAISSQDTMSFIFDIGINTVYKEMKNSNNSSEFKDFGFDHLAISFPIKRWWFTSLGITPYSKIGYNIQETGQYVASDTINMHYDSYGNGGINQVFLSNSFKFYNSLAIGVNINYLFGSLEQYNLTYSDASIRTTAISDDISVSKMSFDLGLQYFDHILDDKYFYVIGLAYSSKTDFNTKQKNSVLNTEYQNYNFLSILDYFEGYPLTIDTLKYSESSDYKIEVPARYSIGVTAGIEEKLVIGFDYSYQDWSEVASNNVNNKFTKDESYNFGIEYTPNKYSLRNYFKKINYRAGMFLNNSYLVLNDQQIQNYGITFGLGFPIANQRTSLNVSYTYGNRGTTDHGLIEENYSLIGINLTLYDFWFIKRKFQ